MAATVVQLPADTIPMLDPSELYRPEIKKMEDFREYSDDKDDPIQLRVRETYRKMHTYQTVDFVKSKMSCREYDELDEYEPMLCELNGGVENEEGKKRVLCAIMSVRHV